MRTKRRVADEAQCSVCLHVRPRAYTNSERVHWCADCWRDPFQSGKVAAGCAPGFAEEYAEREALDLGCRSGLPTYRTPLGHQAVVKGKAADTWPYPRTYIHDDGAVFAERAMPWRDGWGLSYGRVRFDERNAVGEFIAQYAEGRKSGFPFWATFYFSVRTVVNLHVAWPVQDVWQKIRRHSSSADYR